MLDFIDKNKYYIGFFLAITIIFGGLLLLYNKNIFHDLKNKNDKIKDIEIENLKKENEDLKKIISDLETPTKNESEDTSADDEEKEVAETEKINLNDANLTELDALPGIGPTRAQDIIDYREKNDGFQTVEEIKNIKGIGDATFDKMKDLIIVE